MQGGIQLLVRYLEGDEAHIEGAAWALHNVVALHPSNQGAARQAGVMPALVGLLDSGPDSITTECAARCLHALAQVCIAQGTVVWCMSHACMMQLAVSHEGQLASCNTGYAALLLAFLTKNAAGPNTRRLNPFQLACCWQCASFFCCKPSMINKDVPTPTHIAR